MPSSLGALAGAASAPINAYAEYMMQSNLMDKSDAQYKENSRQAYARQRRMTQDATTLAAIGMREAGLNPSSMADPLSPAPITSPAHGSTPQAPKIDTMQGALLGAQIANIEAQTKRTEVETQRLEDEDATADVNLRRHFQSLLDDPNVSETDKKFYQSLVEHAPNYSAGSLKGLDSFFNLSKNATDTLFNRFDKDYKKAVIDANLRNQVPEWLSKLPEQQYYDAVQKIGNIAANTLLLSSETALNSDKADKLKAEIQKEYAEMKHIYHEDFASMWENEDYQSLFVSLAGKVLPHVIEGVVIGKTMKGAKAPSVAPASSSGLPINPNTILGRQVQNKIGGSPKMNAVSRGIFKTFGNDKDRTAFLSLLARRGADVANSSFHQWLASPYRKKYSYADWLGIGEKYHR